MFILPGICERLVFFIDLHLALACLEIDGHRHGLVNLFGAFFLDIKHLGGIVALLVVEPGVVAQLVPILLLIDDPQSAG